MLKSDTRISLQIEFNHPITDEQYKKLFIESITVKTYDLNHKKLKTAKFRPSYCKVYDKNEPDELTANFYCCDIQPVTKTQLREHEISWIEEGTIEIGGITNANLKPKSVTELTIRTHPEMISRELIEYTIFHKCPDEQLTCNADNFDMELNDDNDEGIDIIYEATKETRNNFYTIASKPNKQHAAHDIKTTDNQTSPLYPGDHIKITNKDTSSHYEKYFYDKFSHTWMIQNDGTVPWRNRRLVCTSKDTQSIKMNEYEIPVPNLNPGETGEIRMLVDARGMETTSTSTWIMEDSSDNNCFPNEPHLFEFTVTVKNQSQIPT